MLQKKVGFYNNNKNNNNNNNKRRWLDKGEQSNWILKSYLLNEYECIRVLYVKRGEEDKTWNIIMKPANCIYVNHKKLTKWYMIWLTFRIPDQLCTFIYLHFHLEDLKMNYRKCDPRKRVNDIDSLTSLALFTVKTGRRLTNWKEVY